MTSTPLVDRALSVLMRIARKACPMRCGAHGFVCPNCEARAILKALKQRTS